MRVAETAVDGGGVGGGVPATRAAFLRGNVRGPGGKGRCPRRSGRFRGRKRRLRSARGRFCVAILPVRAAKGAAHGGRGALAGGKNASAACGGVFAWQRSRSRRQRALPTAVAALSRAKKRLRSVRGRFRSLSGPMGGRTGSAAPGLTSGGALVPLRPPPFPHPPQRAGPGASPSAARACTGRQRHRWPAGGRRTSGGCRNGFA